MRSDIALLTVLLGDVRRRPGAALASVLSMAVGVSVFVAILLAGSAARTSFVSAVEAVAGRATHQLTREGGLDPVRLVELVHLEAVEAAQPVVEGRIAVERVGDAPPDASSEDADAPRAIPSLRILGIDPLFSSEFLVDEGGGPVIAPDDFTAFLTDPSAAILPAPWAREVGVEAGDSLVAAAAGRRVEIRVLAVYELDVLGEAARDTAVVDIATAQELLDRTAGIDRIDLIVTPGREDELDAALAPGEFLERPNQRGERVARMIDAFRLNLLALGALALVVGSILVFNAAQFGVVRRGGLLGQLRALGVTRGQLVTGVLTEVVLFGLVGGVLGVALGSFLAQELVGDVVATVRNLYAFVRADVAPLDWAVAGQVVLGTAVVAAAAGLFPALDAARTAPRLVGIRSRGELRFRAQLPRLLVFAATGAALGSAAAFIDAEAWWLGILAAFAFLGAGACTLPPLMAWWLPWLQRTSERLGLISLPLGAGAILRSLTRTGGAAAALGVALSMAIGVSVMVASFEREVRRWIGATLRADIFVADASQSVSGDAARIPSQAVAELRGAAGVRIVDTLRGVEVPFADRSVFFCGVEFQLPESWERIEMISGSLDEAKRALVTGDALVSEPFSNRYGLGVGDSFTLPGRAGPEEFAIAGVFRDFSFDRGYGFTGVERFERLFGEVGVRNAAVYLEDGADLDEVASRLRASFAGRFDLVVRSNAELRQNVMRVFDSTFAVTYVLQFIATVLALGGIAVTLLGLFLERAREIATLRAIGTSVFQVGRVFAAESLVMALFPVLLAVPLGALLAWILITVVNQRAFGWTIGFDMQWGSSLVTCVLAVLAGLLASVAPIALVRRQSIAAALREE